MQQKNKINFCTLFDSNYLHFGLPLYASLLKHCRNFHLYIFAFDKKCEDFLRKSEFENVTIISLQEFEDEKLLAVKPTRSKGEYCWTSTPSVIRYVLKNYDVESCTYIDADIFFYSDPKPLIDEMGEKSVLITSHRYSLNHDQSEKSGKYCVQFMVFKNNQKGLKVLEWWRERCIEWCYNKVEKGKFGDQKYLDDWMARFDSVHELKNLGGGVAPWNVEQYSFTADRDKIIGKEKSSAKTFELIFYHFHALKLLNKNAVQLTAKEYKITPDILHNIYKSYMIEIENSVRLVDGYSEFLEMVKNKNLGFFDKIKLSLFAMKKNIIKRSNGLHN